MDRTEETYVNNLDILVNNFARPLKSNPNFGLTQEDASDMFMNIEILYELHKDLLDSLKALHINPLQLLPC